MKDGASKGNRNFSAGLRTNEDFCLDLLHGLLPAEEKEELLTRIATDPALEQTFREMVAERERMKASRELKLLPSGKLAIADVPATDTTISDQAVAGPSERPRQWERLLAGLRRPRYRLGLGLATAAALAVLVVWPQIQPTPYDDLLRRLPSYGDDLRFRAATESSIDDNLIAGLAAYGQGQDRRAISLLEATETTNELETVRRLYLGSALAHRGQYRQAMAHLEAFATSSLPDPWGSEARWTLFVAMLGAKRTASADSLLQMIAADPGEVGERARQFLQNREEH
jgi:hypothetical protein